MKDRSTGILQHANRALEDATEKRGALQSGVRSVERAADILLSFSESEPVLNLARIQQATGLSRPTLYRLLRTLEGKGLIYSFGNPRRFQLGHRIGTLTKTWEQHPALVAIARDWLERLRDSTQETVALMVPVSCTHRLCAIEMKSPHPISFSRGNGYTEPLFRGVSGKVLLAYMSPDLQAQAVARLSRHAKEQVLKELAEIRRQGWWVTRAEIISGAVALAAPVFSSNREVVASVCVFGTQLRMGPRKLTQCRRSLQATAKALSQELL